MVIVNSKQDSENLSTSDCYGSEYNSIQCCLFSDGDDVLKKIEHKIN